MKNLSFICFLSLLIFFSACSEKQVVEPETIEFDGLQLRIVNKTEHDLVDTKAYNLDFGTVEANETTDYKTLESIMLLPDISANIRGLDYYGGFFCGTGVETVTEGSYTLYVNGTWDIEVIGENTLDAHLEEDID
ncbi:MAG: hypothetical protein ACPG5B_02675 [Chitinophagales bacterium]